MADANMTNVDIDVTVAAAARMTAHAQLLGQLWDEVDPQLQGLHDLRPWSDDAVGQDFADSYLPAAAAIRDAASALIDRLTDSGTNVGLAALDSDSADQDSAATMGGTGSAEQS